MYTIIFLSVVTNAFFLWLLFYSHRKGERHVLGVGLFFLVVSLVILVALYVRNYHADAPAGMKEQVFEDYNEKIEWLLAIFGFVPAVFTGNMISKGLDGVYLKRQAQPEPADTRHGQADAALGSTDTAQGPAGSVQQAAGNVQELADAAQRPERLVVRGVARRRGAHGHRNGPGRSRRSVHNTH